VSTTPIFDRFSSLATQASQGMHDAVAAQIANEPALASLQDEYGSTLLIALSRVAAPDLLRALLARSSNVDHVDSEGESALTSVIRGIHDGTQAIDALAVILEAGVDPNVVGFLGQAPLHLAASLDELEVARLLLSRGAVPTLRAADIEGETPLEIAHANGFAAMEALLRGSAAGNP
jgi:ankyrin repeat protein